MDIGSLGPKKLLPRQSEGYPFELLKGPVLLHVLPREIFDLCGNVISVMLRGRGRASLDNVEGATKVPARLHTIVNPRKIEFVDEWN